MAQDHFQKVVQHARTGLRLEAADKDNAPDGRIKRYKRFLKVEERRLRMFHEAGGGGVESARRRCALMDEVIGNLLADLRGLKDQKELAALPFALLATGGYGRGELNPKSDLDLLFLMEQSSLRLPPDLQRLIEELLTFLWDIGLKVGHAVRNVKEALEQANKDNMARTALIESRLMFGNERLCRSLQARFRPACIDGQEEKFLLARQEDLKARHAKHSNTVFLQEPNVKQGCGGLRDFQNLLWMSWVRLETMDLKELAEKKMLTESGRRELEKGYDFLMRVRTELHYLENRATDILTLRLQGQVAENFHYPQKTLLRQIEFFMRDYYTHSRNILQRSSELMDRFHLQQAEQKSAGKSWVHFLAEKRPKSERFDGFIWRLDRLFAENDGIFQEDPARLMRLFQHTQLRAIRLSPELFNLVQASFTLVNKAFRYHAAVFDTFSAILSRRGQVAATLRQMHRTGFLGKYIPEFGQLTCLVQHEFFHRYTADEHTLKTIDQLDELVLAEEPKVQLYRQLFLKMIDPFTLYLALIMHDTGRAENVRSHADASTVMALRVARRWRLTPERRRLLLFLVDNHLLLWRTATTKNLDDSAVIEEFAAVVKHQEYLDALLIMTYADSKGTSDEGWTGWKETLMQWLYQRATRFFQDRDAFRLAADQPREELLAAVLEELPPALEDDARAHFEHMPAHYFPFRNAAVIALHVRQFHRLFENVALSVNALLLPTLYWEHHPERGYSKLTVTSLDRRLLLAKIAGALAANQINILSADFFRRSDDVVLDIFRVCTPKFQSIDRESIRQRIETLICQAFSDPAFDAAQLFRTDASALSIEKTGLDAPQRAQVLSDVSPDHTVIDIQAHDRVGLLYEVFLTISNLGLETTNARISTEKGAAFDVIHIQTDEGEKVTDLAVLSELGKRLSGVINREG